MYYVGPYDLLAYSELQNKPLVFVDMYDSLLDKLNRLAACRISHFDLKDSNVMVDHITRMAVVIDFGLSLNWNKINVANEEELSHQFWGGRLSIFPQEKDIYTCWCCDIVIVNLILSADPVSDVSLWRETLTELYLKTTISAYVRYHSLFRLNGAPDREKYSLLLQKKYSKYIGRIGSEIVADLCHPDKVPFWDQFSLAVMFLKVIIINFCFCCLFFIFISAVNSPAFTFNLSIIVFPRDGRHHAGSRFVTLNLNFGVRSD